MDTNILNVSSIMMVICIKQHLSNIWSSIFEKVKQHRGWVEKKRCLNKKRVVKQSFKGKTYSKTNCLYHQALIVISYNQHIIHRAAVFVTIMLFLKKYVFLNKYVPNMSHAVSPKESLIKRTACHSSFS